MTSRRLSATSVLVAEDEAIVAIDLVDMIEANGGTVLGPCTTIQECHDVIDMGLPDVAILDVRLGRHEVFEVAESLVRQQVPILFHSGHMGIDEMGTRFPQARFCSKPTSQEQLLTALEEILAETGA